MAFIANYLAGRLHRIVVDKTGIPGSFDFTVDLAVDQEDVKDANLAEQDVVGHMFADLTSKLGLKLQPQNLPITTLTVIRAEKPLDN